MSFFNSKIKRFLMAIAGKDTTPDPDSPYERCLADIAKRLEKIEAGMLPEAAAEDAGKVPVAQEDKSYALEEVGGGGGAFYVGMTVDGGGAYVLDKTWQEIADAIIAKTPAYITVSDTVNDYYALWPINGAKEEYGRYLVIFSTDGGGNGPSDVVSLEASTKNGHPKYRPD